MLVWSDGLDIRERNPKHKDTSGFSRESDNDYSSLKWNTPDDNQEDLNIKPVARDLYRQGGDLNNVVPGLRAKKLAEARALKSAFFRSKSMVEEPNFD